MTGAFRLVSRSEDATRRLGRLLGGALQPGLTVLLSGDLGAGKTVFVKGVGDALGLEAVRSPSFTLINEYRSERLILAHADLYRLDEDGAEELGLEEYAGSGDAVLIVEWPERWRFPPDTDVLRVTLRAPEEGVRVLEVRACGPRAAAAAAALYGAAAESGAGDAGSAGNAGKKCLGAGLCGEGGELP